MRLVSRLAAARRAGKLKHARELAPRELAALQGRLADAGPGAVPSLLDCLGHAEARGPALEVLARLLDEDSVPLSLEALASPNPAIVSGAAWPAVGPMTSARRGARGALAEGSP